MCHQHALPPTQGELFLFGSGDLCIDGLSKSKRYVRSCTEPRRCPVWMLRVHPSNEALRRIDHLVHAIIGRCRAHYRNKYSMMVFAKSRTGEGRMAQRPICPIRACKLLDATRRDAFQLRVSAPPPSPSRLLLFTPISVRQWKPQ